ncbi:MAG: aminoacyl-tRNA hydrolase [Spirochaetales bacterium]|nr:aminoacyl-tRNA hydrolase [Spirochaetales bacterium]
MEPAILTECISKNISISFSRSSGPGGQNVNKLNTRVTVRLKIADLEVLSDEQKDNVARKLKNRINEQGELVIHVQDERSQGKNREIAIIRMVQLIMKSLKKRKTRVPTKPSPPAKEKRLKEKKIRSELKKQRKKS